MKTVSKNETELSPADKAFVDALRQNRLNGAPVKMKDLERQMLETDSHQDDVTPSTPTD